MLASCMMSAQVNNSRLNVKYLKLIENDTEASRARKTDGNGDKCALVKIQTPNMGEADRDKLEFSADMGTFTYPEKATGEVKLFLTEGCKTLIILHPEYGKLIYPMPVSVQGFKTYEMVLEVKKDGSGSAIVISSNYVLIKATPSDALISIDGNFYPDGSAYISVDEPHDLVVSRSLYHDYEKTIYASSKETMTYEAKLAPAFGWLLIDSSPESGATILVNGVRKGVTPYRSDTLASGEYEVTLMREMYENVTKTVRVVDNNVSEISIPMKPNFANVTISTDVESDIYVDGKLNARGSWTGRLLQGSHKVEARKASHRTTAMALEITAGKDENVKLDAPMPIYGAINVTSSPVEATVYLDGTEIGKTPFVNNKVLIGSHELRIVKQGCAPFVKTITVEEGKMTDVSERLQTGREISISTDRQGDQLYADGNYLGASPLTATLSFGTHTIKAVRDSKAVEKTITVSQTGGDNAVRLAFFENKTFTVNGVTFEMVAVKGGTFTMGATSEQRRNAYDDEMPTHSVTLSDYYIGKFEVTQELWEAVMGSNPSSFKGSKLPVEQVRWDDCQTFIRKLNSLTGANFRLPTEAEWEYAARGGNRSGGYKYSGSNSISKVAWYDGNSGSKTHAVGTKSPNELGIYDMSGNVYEWCQDWYGSYSSGSQTNPQGPSSGSYRVARGGSWYDYARGCRVSSRNGSEPDGRTDDLGLRLAL